MKELVKKKGKKKNNFVIISYINLGLTLVCLIIFLTLSICFNDYTYLYGSLISLPSSWLQIMFYYFFYKKIEFPHSRSGFNRSKTTINYMMLFFLKAFVVYLPFIIVMILYGNNIYIFNVYAVVTCALISPIIFFFIRFFLFNKEPQEGGD